MCDGSLTLSAAGLARGTQGDRPLVLDRAAAETRIATIFGLGAADRRYVVDRGVATSTGITASIPLMLALVEAIGGRDTAQDLSMRLGVTDWDARHDSAAFKLTLAHKKAFLRNELTFWRRDTVAVKVGDDVDEIALGPTADARSRTELSKVIGVGRWRRDCAKPARPAPSTGRAGCSRRERHRA